MKCKKSNSIFLCGVKMCSKKSCCLDIIVKRETRSIIKGTIYSKKGTLVDGATIEVREINPNTKRYIILGYSVTNDRGEYIFAIEPILGMIYEFIIYSPLI